MNGLETASWAEYGTYVALLVFARGMDFLSTWIASPRLELEANPIARRMGWKWGAVVNLVLCSAAAFWPLPAIIIATTSLLVASRNLQSAWLMRTLGEAGYRCQMREHLMRVSAGLFIFCLLGQTILVAAVGVGLVWFSGWFLVPFAVGVGMIGYALAVTIYTSLAFWRLRRPAPAFPAVSHGSADPGASPDIPHEHTDAR